MRLHLLATHISFSLLLNTALAIGGEITPDSVSLRLQTGDRELSNDLAAVPIAEAESTLWEVWRQNIREHPQIAKASLEVLTHLPGVAQYYEDRVLAMPHLEENGSLRGTMLNALGRLRTRWSLNLLGKVMLDSKQMTSEIPAHLRAEAIIQLGGTFPNQVVAAAVMGEMNLSHWPVQKKGLFYTDDDLRRIRDWWQKNQKQPDSYFFGEEQSPALNRGVQESPRLGPPAQNAPPPPPADKEPVRQSDTTFWVGWTMVIVSIAGFLWLFIRKRAATAPR